MSLSVSPCRSHAPFDLLLPELVGEACSYLETRPLLMMRRVSRRWGAGSRMSHAWVASHWRVHREWDWSAGTDANSTQNMAALHLHLAQIASLMPYLRSLHMPYRNQRITYSSLAPLKMIERVYVDTPPIDFCLLAQLPRLRVLNVSFHPSSVDNWTAADTTRLGSLSVTRFRADRISCPHDLVAQLSTSSLARFHLGILELHGTQVVSFAAEDIARFGALEELSLKDTSFNLDSFHALTSAPALRLLTLGRLDDGTTSESLSALLSNPEFSRRLEYLSLDRCSFGELGLHRLMSECTSLLVLALSWRWLHRPGDQHRARAFENTFAPVTECEWKEYEEMMRGDDDRCDDGPQDRPCKVRRTRSDSEQQRRLIAASNVHADQPEGEILIVSPPPPPVAPFDPSEGVPVDLLSFLTGPAAFRRRLLYLHLDYCKKDADVARQVWRRYPRLVCWPQPPVMLRPHDMSPAGLDFLPAEQPPIGQMRAERLSSDRTTESNFRWLRALKLHCRLPLTPSEQCEQSRWL